MLVPYHEFKLRRAVWRAVLKNPATRHLIAGLIYMTMSRGTLVIDAGRVRYLPAWVLRQTDEDLEQRVGQILALLLPENRGRGA